MVRLKTLILAAGLVVAACVSTPPPAPVVKPATLYFPQPPDTPRFAWERAIYGSADVIAEESGGEFRRLVTGEGKSTEGLSKPYAVAVHKGRVYVSDSAERYIKVFDFPSGKYWRVGEDDPGRIVKPLGIDVDHSGRLYVADVTARDIKIFSAEGRYERSIGGPKWFDRLSSVTVDPAGTRLYVVDIGGVSSSNHRIRVFDPRTGEHLSDIGTRGAGPGEFNLPRDLAVGKDGRLYVVDGGNFRIQVLTADGKFIKSFGAVGKQFGQFARPKEIATDSEGNVYVVDSAFGNFQIFSADGDLLMFVGERSERDGPGKYMLPSGVYVDEDGRVYMVDQWFRKVEVYRPVRLESNQGWLGKRNAAPGAAAKR